MPTIKLHDESLNVYGFWCLTSGGRFDSFKKNPLMLYNHIEYNGYGDKVLPIGMWEKFKVKETEIFADPDFDEEDDFAKKIKSKVDRNYLRMASIGIRIIKTSDNPELMKPGQTRETVIEWELREGSVVDIGANRNALVLYDQDGKQISLKDDGSNCPVPLVKLKDDDNNSTTTITKPDMALDNLKVIAGFLAMTGDATLSDVQSKILKLMSFEAENKKLKDQLKEFKDAQLNEQKEKSKVLLDAAIKDKQITADQRSHFESLFDKDFDSASELLKSFKPVPLVTDVLKDAGGEADTGVFKYKGKTFSEWRKERGTALSDLKKNNLEIFKQLYKSEFGKDYTE